jgi:hypothetical protein
VEVLRVELIKGLGGWLVHYNHLDWLCFRPLKMSEQHWHQKTARQADVHGFTAKVPSCLRNPVPLERSSDPV